MYQQTPSGDLTIKIMTLEILLDISSTNIPLKKKMYCIVFKTTPKECGKWWEINHQSHYAYQSLLSSFHYSILCWSSWCTQLENNLMHLMERIKLTRHTTLIQSKCLICLPNRLSDPTLNSMNVSKALDFLYTYPKLDYLSVK